MTSPLQVNIAIGSTVTLRVQTVLSCASGVSCAICDALSSDASALESCYRAGCFCFGTLVTAEANCSGIVKELERQQYGCAQENQGITLPPGSLVATTVYDLDVGSDGAG